MALRALEKAPKEALMMSPLTAAADKTADKTPSAMPCHEMMGMATGADSAPGVQQADKDCCALAGACALMCHITVAMLSVTPDLQALDAVAVHASGRTLALHSATVAPAIKPPIS